MKDVHEGNDKGSSLAGTAIETTIKLLREIARRSPEVLQHTDIEAFITAELEPAQEMANKDRRACSSLMGMLADARSASARTFEDGVEAAAAYCETTLAGNHPSLAHAYRHAATNIRGFAGFDPNAAPQASSNLPEGRREDGPDTSPETGVKGRSLDAPGPAGAAPTDEMNVLRMALGNTAACLGDALATYNKIVGQEVFKNAEPAPEYVESVGK